MRFSEFVCTIEKLVSERVGEHERVEIHRNMKNNGTERVGLLIRSTKVNITPAIYLEEYYDRWVVQGDLEGIVSEILLVDEQVKIKKSFDADFLKEYETVREKLAFKVVHYEKNKEFLEEVPHIKYLDLAIVFYILIDESDIGLATMVVRNTHKKTWKVETEELFDDALRSAVEILPSCFQPMTEVVSELLVEKTEGEMEGAEEAMFVLSNRNRNLGAACMLYDGMLENIASFLSEDYYVIPSSIHEVIIVPISKSPKKNELDVMIREINESQLDEEEVLSNCAYYYSRREQRLLY